jgi:hypothetical protein
MRGRGGHQGAPLPGSRQFAPSNRLRAFLRGLSFGRRACRAGAQAKAEPAALPVTRLGCIRLSPFGCHASGRTRHPIPDTRPGRSDVRAEADEYPTSTSDLRPRTSDFGLRISDLGPCLCVRPPGSRPEEVEACPGGRAGEFYAGGPAPERGAEDG